MPSIPLELPPGLVKSVTPGTVPGRYVAMDKGRFRSGKPEKIGGYELFIDDMLTGIPRGAYGWVSVDGSQIANFGTQAKVYAILQGEVIDLTPVRATGSLGTDPFAVVSGDATVTVTDVAHGVEQGAYVTFAGASAGGGITIVGTYPVATVIDPDSYTIEHTSAATSTDATTGGASVTFSYEINPGPLSTSYGLGYGAGPYGLGTYGTPRTGITGIELELRNWFFARYGGSLMMLPSGGTLYEWDEDGGSLKGVAVTNAPTARAMFITAERYIFLLGTTTPMTVSWPDRDDITDWTPGVTDTANNRALMHGNKLMCGASLTDGISVIWSDTSLFLFQYGGALVYDSRLVGTNCGIVGAHAHIEVDQLTYWLSKRGFLYYNGSVQPIPNEADIRDWLLDHVSGSNVDKVWAGYNPKYNEIWFGVPLDGAQEVDTIAILNLHDYSWTTCEFPRSAMTFIPSGVNSVLLAGQDGYIYEHEIGKDAAGAAMHFYVTSGLIALGGTGDMDAEMYRFVPDTQRQTGNIGLRLRTYKRMRVDAPNVALDDVTTTVTTLDFEVEPRVSGRYFDFTIESDEVGGDVRMGRPTLEIGTGGER